MPGRRRAPGCIRRGDRSPDDAATHVEEVYQLDKSGVFGPDGRASPEHARAQALVRRQITRAAALLRDLAYTAWVRSGEKPKLSPADNPTLQTQPRYNPATGSAPAPRRSKSADTDQPQEMHAMNRWTVWRASRVPRCGAGLVEAGWRGACERADGSPKRTSAHYQPITWPDEVSGKNFPLFASSRRTRRRGRRSRRRRSCARFSKPSARRWRRRPRRVRAVASCHAAAL